MLDKDKINHVTNCLNEHHFPLCRRAGLEIHEGLCSLVKAKDVESLLSNAPVVYGTSVDGKTISFSDPSGRRNTALGHEDNYQARLIMIEPIVKKSREERLEEWIKDFIEWSGSMESGNRWAGFREKAKQLLSERETDND